MSGLGWIKVMIAVLAGLMSFQLPATKAPAADGAHIDYFCYYHTGSSTYDIYSYDVRRDEDTGELTVYYEFLCGYETYELPCDDMLMQQLMSLVAEHELHKWDGFRKSDPHMLDGYGFGLSVGFDDGTEIYATGSNSYPAGYNEAAQAIDELFRGYIEKYGIEPEGIY